MDPERLAQHLRVLMKARSLTQKALAEKSTVDKMVINRILKQHAKNVSGKTITRIASALELQAGSSERTDLFLFAGYEEGWPVGDDRAELDPGPYISQIQGGGRSKGPSAPSPKKRRPLKGMRALSTPEEVAKVLVHLLEEAAELGPLDPGQIYTTFQGATNLFDMVTWMREEYAHAFAAALRAGWNVIHVDRAEGPPERFISWVSEMPELLGTLGTFRPMRYRGSGALQPSYDLALVPGIGGVLLFSTKQAEYVDGGYFFPNRYGRDRDFLATLKAHFELLKSGSDELLTTYPPRSMDFLEAINEAQERDGDCFVVIDGIRSYGWPVIRRHERRAAPVLARGGPDADLAHRIIESERRQWTSFQHQADRFDFVDICPESGITHLPSDDWLTLLGAEPRSEVDLLVRLRNLVDVIDKYPRYKFVLIKDSAIPYISRTYWMVKSWDIAFFETWRLQEGEKVEVDLAIKDKSAVTGLRHHLSNILQSSFVQSDRDIVKSILLDRIRSIEGSISASDLAEIDA